MAESPDPSQQPRKQSQSNSYLKYSGLAIQLLATIGISGWLGYLVDGWLGLRLPIFMIVFGFLGFAGMMYQLYRSINKE
jgi:F0F1-type ATP synthase assembly protein I